MPGIADILPGVVNAHEAKTALTSTTQMQPVRGRAEKGSTKTEAHADPQAARREESRAKGVNLPLEQLIGPAVTITFLGNAQKALSANFGTCLFARFSRKVLVSQMRNALFCMLTLQTHPDQILGGTPTRSQSQKTRKNDNLKLKRKVAMEFSQRDWWH